MARHTAPRPGIDGFEPHFGEAWSWRYNQVWTYRLQRAGVELRDARIDFHWLDGEFQGLRVCVQRPILTRADDPSASAADVDASEQIWYPKRRIEDGGDGYDIVLAQVQRSNEELHVRTQYTIGGMLLSTTFTALPVAPGTPAIAHAWTEYDVPSGVFPNQIETDSSGKVWFSQPNDNKVTSFDPVSETFSSPPANMAVPDGLIIDSQDRLWTGLYSTNAGLGLVDTLTGTFSSFPAPYAGGPVDVLSNGDVVATGRNFGAIYIFHPATQTFDRFLIPTASAGIKDGVHVDANDVIWVTESGANKIAKLVLQ